MLGLGRTSGCSRVSSAGESPPVSRVRTEGDCDVVGHAVTIVGNILNLFIRVVTLLAEQTAAEKQRKEETKRASWKRRT